MLDPLNVEPLQPPTIVVNNHLSEATPTPTQEPTPTQPPTDTTAADPPSPLPEQITETQKYKPTTMEKLLKDETNQSRLASEIKGVVASGTSPVDVTVVIDGIEHGISVYSMQDNQDATIKLRHVAGRRKESWLEETNNRRLHTVVFDDRTQQQDGESGTRNVGGRLYYRESVGSYDLTDMTEVNTFTEIRELLRESGKFEPLETSLRDITQPAETQLLLPI